MDSNRITGPGYYPRRPTPEDPWHTPSAPLEWPAACEGHRWWQFRRGSTPTTPEAIRYDLDHGLGDWVWFEARDGRHAEERAELAGIRWGRVWGRCPARGFSTGNSGYRHYLDGRVERVR